VTEQDQEPGTIAGVAITKRLAGPEPRDDDVTAQIMRAKADREFQAQLDDLMTRHKATLDLLAEQ